MTASLFIRSQAASCSDIRNQIIRVFYFPGIPHNAHTENKRDNGFSAIVRCIVIYVSLHDGIHIKYITHSFFSFKWFRSFSCSIVQKANSHSISHSGVQGGLYLRRDISVSVPYKNPSVQVHCTKTERENRMCAINICLFFCHCNLCTAFGSYQGQYVHPYSTA